MKKKGKELWIVVFPFEKFHKKANYLIILSILLCIYKKVLYALKMKIFFAND
jgi:hypothetical protein